MVVERRRGRIYLNGRELAELGVRPCARCGDFLLAGPGLLPPEIARRVRQLVERRRYRRGPGHRRKGRTWTALLPVREAETATARGYVAEPDPRPPELVAERPRTRGDCADGPRPCPWVSCKFHNFLEVTPEGAIYLNFPDQEPDQLTDSCALDVADEDGVILDRVARAAGVTRERARQLERKAILLARRRTPERQAEALRLELVEPWRPHVGAGGD